MARHLAKPDQEMNQRLAEALCAYAISNHGAGTLPDRTVRGPATAREPDASLVLSPNCFCSMNRSAHRSTCSRIAPKRPKRIFARLQQTAVLVTHDLAEAAYLGNEIVLINDGRIVQQGVNHRPAERPAMISCGNLLTHSEVSYRYETSCQLLVLRADRLGNRRATIIGSKSLPNPMSGRNREALARKCRRPSRTPPGYGWNDHSLGSATGRTHSCILNTPARSAKRS